MKEEVTDSMHLSFGEKCGCKTTWTRFNKECILATENLYLVCWRELRETRKDFHKLHWLWLAK